ncbi:hypothetical protein [Sphingobacterium bovistauri]|uniref:Uncharacterized protein n=1 Tax=Sphingobacterium bovistauri TaxID=2781959 RepID=A0ABS7Z9H6_9SPHI|nr:hypothetical protein [Sphingobacterium bovistauri]MCA5006663.1 hypothetical protein [Sphingobacterium bovistauri]
MKRLLSILFMVITMLCTQAQEKVTFRLAPEFNKPLKYEMVTKMDIEGPQTVIMDMLMHMDMTYSSFEDSLVNIAAKYSYVKVDVDAGMMTASYDSSKEPLTEIEKIFATQFKPIIENTLTYTMNKLGHIKNIDFPNVSDQIFDKSSVSSFGTTYPNYSISIGDSWNAESKIEQLNVIAKSTFKLAEKTAQGYKIESTVNLEDATGKSVGTTTGYFVVDAKTFTTVSSSTITSVEMQGAKIKTTTELNMVK